MITKYRLFATAIFILFSSWLITSSLYFPFSFDHAIFSVVAKNVAYGNGFVMSYHDRVPFFYMTTGPAAILPVSLVLMITGNKIWATSLGITLFNLSLYGGFLFYLSKTLKYKDSEKLGFIFFFSFLLLYFKPLQWNMFVGEIASLLVFFIACLIAADDRISKNKKNILLGLSAGLSLQIKATALPGFGGIALYITYKTIQESDSVSEAIKNIFHAAFIGLGTLALSQVPFRVFEMVNTMAFGYSLKDLFDFKSSIYSSNASVDFWTRYTGDVLQNNIRRINWYYSMLKNQSEDFGIGKYGYVLYLGIILIYAGLMKAGKVTKDEIFKVFFFGLVVYIFWLLFLAGPGFEKMLLHPVINLYLLLALIICKSKHIWLPVVVVALLVMLLPDSKSIFLKDYILYKPVSERPDKKDLQLNQDILRTEKFIRNSNLKYPMANCGWGGATRSLEYILPGHTNFKDCTLLIRSAISSKEDAGRVSYYWNSEPSFVLVINKIYWQFVSGIPEVKQRQKALFSSCAQNTVYDSMFFSIMECHFADLKKNISLERSSPFINPDPDWKRRF